MLTAEMLARTSERSRLERAPKRKPLEVRPDSVVPLRRSGAQPYRVLAFGGGALMGWGQLDHDLGLAGAIADDLAATSGHGVDLDVIIDADPTRPEALAGLLGLRLRRYDAVLVVLGERGADDIKPQVWAAEMHSLGTAVHEQAARSAPVFVYDSAAAMATVINEGMQRRRAVARAVRSAQIAEEVFHGGRVRFDVLEAPSDSLGWGRRFSTSSLRTWSHRIVDELRPALANADRADPVDSPRAFRDRIQDERYRQRAVDSMRLVQGERNALFDGIAKQARSAFRAEAAAVNIVDGPLVWQLASSTSDSVDIPRESSICDLTVRSDGLTLINDTSTDARIAGSPLRIVGRRVAFYAGEPIRTVDGYRIGTLCLFDSAPRAMRPAQLGELHDLAGRIERELWAQVLGARR